MAGIEGFFSNSCISAPDMGIERRPYHRSCGCALHERLICPHALPKHNNISFTIRRSWSEGCLAMALSASSSPSSSPAVAPAAGRTKILKVFHGEEEETDIQLKRLVL